MELDGYCFALRSELDIRGINATLALWSNRTRDFWKSPRVTFIRIEGLVVVAAIMVLFMAIFGSWRRKRRSFFIQKGVLGAYILSSSLVTYLLGSMQSSVVKSSMYPIWAISLYILIGCADSITAYSLDDNKQLYRQFYQLMLNYIYVGFLVATISSKQAGSIPAACLVVIALIKCCHRFSASQMASISWNLNKMVADYMYQEHSKSGPAYDPASMKGYHYLVDWPLRSDSELDAGILCASDLKADAQVIDIEKVWQCKHMSLSEELKYTCLSFSLFHLLRRRFFGFECSESSIQPKTHDFVFKGLLLSKNEDGVISYNQAFKVIEVELAFIYDFFFTKYAAVYYGSWVGAFMPVASACLVPVMAYLTVSRVVKIPSGMKGDIILDTTRADVVITVVLLVCIALLEVLQVLYFWTTIWGRVSLACQCVREQAQNKQRGCCMRFKEILTKIGVSMSNERYFEEKLGQYSLLEESLSYLSEHNFISKLISKVIYNIDPMVIHPYNYNLWSLLTKARKYIRVPEEVKEAVLQSLELTDGKLTNGTSSLVLNSAPHLLWACRHSESIVSYTQKKENQACFILTWHIATCYCELATLKYFRASVGGELKVHFDVARTLSKYSAYLVVEAPKLLPGHHYDTRRVFEAVAKEAVHFLGDEKDKYKAMRTLLERSREMPESEEKILIKGIRLGEQLEGMEVGACWKVLADFWAEMLLYVAPSDNVKEHIEGLTRGGEFVTYLWALLSHAGILKREEHQVGVGGA